MLRSNFKILLCFFSVVFIFSSCYPDDERTIAETEVTITYYDTSFNFAQTLSKDVVYFEVADSLALIKGSDNLIDKTTFYSVGGANDRIRGWIIQGFERKGWVQAGESDVPDFSIHGTALATKTVVQGYFPWWHPGFPDYWHWWGGWFPGYPGWYPWYPGYVYSYESGYLMFEMVPGPRRRAYQQWHIDNPNLTLEDLETTAIPPSSQLRFIWQANITGLLSDNNNLNYTIAEQGVREAFDQSPYLNKR
ncbi:MAG: DUF4136 domain-containing protein [Cytophagales bacterium]|nr:DUF4136 domain-containing protein [Cytophagales bacterium]